jgi:uncharacterized protein (TIGR03118 family)
MNKLARFSLVTTAITVGTLYVGAWRAEADFIQTNLVSDVADLAPSIIDPNLVNPWGSSRSATSPFWISNQVTNTSTLYNVSNTLNVTKQTLTVSIPQTGIGPQGPTGQVANPTSSFQVTIGGVTAAARFIFADLNGTISGWNGTGTAAGVAVPSVQGVVYTGLAIQTSPQPQLYAARAGGIDVFDGSFTKTGTIATPSTIPAGLIPFNVQTLSNGNLAVTYAPAGPPDNQRHAPSGAGAVAIFAPNGTLLQTILGGPTVPLAAPLLLPRPVSVRSAATCWSAISVSSPARSTPSTQQPECSRARSRLI